MIYIVGFAEYAGKQIKKAKEREREREKLISFVEREIVRTERPPEVQNE